MITIIQPKQAKSYNEIPQQMPGTFAFLYKIDDNTYEQKHSPQKCRDFLGDSVWSDFNKQPISIYAFEFDPETEKLDSDATRLVYYGKQEGLFHNLKTLHEIERKNGLVPTKLFLAENGIVIEGDKKWSKYVWCISLYSFIIKVLANGSFKDIPEGSNESYYVSNLNLDFLLDHIKDLMDTESKTITGWEKEKKGVVHDDSGFFSLFRAKVNNSFSKRYHELLSAA